MCCTKGRSQEGFSIFQIMEAVKSFKMRLINNYFSFENIMHYAKQKQ